VHIGSFHQVIVTGKIIKELELYITDSEIPVLKMSIPTNYEYRNGTGDKIRETVWFNVTLRGVVAEVAHKTLKRGDHIQVIGRLVPEVKVREMKNGRVVGEYEVIADEVIFLQGGFKNDG
jgi:single-strand DNA-binding protein